MYITLPSNASLEVFPENTLANYKTKLPHPIRLQGDWEMGLAQLHFPINWKNVDPGSCLLYCTIHGQTKKFQFPAGSYNEPYKIRTALRKASRDLFREFDMGSREKRQAVLVSGFLEKEKMFFVSYNEATRKMTFNLMEGVELRFSDRLSTILGHDGSTITESCTMTYPLNLNVGFFSIFVYCDLLEPQFVGDSFTPLLGIVPIQGNFGEYTAKVYERIQYIPLQKKSFDTIELDLRTDTGEKVPFLPGRVVAIVHLRRKNASA